MAEIFEVRKPKNEAIIATKSGHVEIDTKDYKAKRRVYIIDDTGQKEEFLIPKDKYLIVQDGSKVDRGDALTDGTPSLNDILKIQGIEKMAEYLISEVQGIYRAQGVMINDKHIEVIVRQMMQKVEISESNDSTFLVGEQPDRSHFEWVCNKLEEEGRKPPRCEPLLLGITKASLHTKSFISAASFQETTRVLTEAAVSGKVDKLEGLKENVIVGRLVPAGTGRYVQRLIAKAREQNMQQVIERNQKETLVTTEDSDQKPKQLKEEINA